MNVVGIYASHFHQYISTVFTAEMSWTGLLCLHLTCFIIWKLTFGNRAHGSYFQTCFNSTSPVC